MLRALSYLFAVLIFLVPPALYSQISLGQLRNKAKQKMQQVENATTSPSTSATPATNSGTNATATAATPVAAGQPAAQNSANAAVKTGPTRFMFCKVEPRVNSNPLRVYYSTIFVTNARKDQTVWLAFADYVSTKYSEPGYASCDSGSTIDQAEAELKRDEDLMGNHQNKRKVIPTEWKYDAGAATEPVSSSSQSASSNPAPVLPGNSAYSMCIAGGATRMEGGGMQMHKVPMPLYVSDIYLVPRDRDVTRADSKAFAQFLGTKYDPYFKNQIKLCGAWTSMARAQAVKNKIENDYRNQARQLPHDYPNSNIIETEWKWDGQE